MITAEQPLWTPSTERIALSETDRFRRYCEDAYRVTLPDHDALHAWSIKEADRF